MQNGKAAKDPENPAAEAIRSRRSSQGRSQKMKQQPDGNSKRSHNARNANEKVSQELIASLQSIKQDEVHQNYYHNPFGDEAKAHLRPQERRLKFKGQPIKDPDFDAGQEAAVRCEARDQINFMPVSSQDAEREPDEQGKPQREEVQQSPQDNQATRRVSEIALPEAQGANTAFEADDDQKLVNKKRIEYINQLKEELDNKIKLRYSNL